MNVERKTMDLVEYAKSELAKAEKESKKYD